MSLKRHSRSPMRQRASATMEASMIHGEGVGPSFRHVDCKWSRGVLCKDGQVYCPPCSADQVLRINTTGSCTIDLLGPKLMQVGREISKWKDKNVLSPHNEVTEKWTTAVLGDEGDVWCPPCNASQVLCISPEDGDVDLVGAELGCTGWKWTSAVLGPDGNVYCPPYNARRVLRIDTKLRKVELIGPDFECSPGKWAIAIVGVDGNIYCPPYNASQVLRIKPAENTAELLGPNFGSGEAKWKAGVIKGAHIFCPPCSASRVLSIDTAVFVPEPPKPKAKAKRRTSSDTSPVRKESGSPDGSPKGSKEKPKPRLSVLTSKPKVANLIEEKEPRHGLGMMKYTAAALGKDGNIYCPPYCAEKPLWIDTENGESDVIDCDLEKGLMKWSSAVLGKDGAIYCPPYNAAKVLRISSTHCCADLLEEDFGAKLKWDDACVGTDGSLYCVPYGAAKVMRLVMPVHRSASKEAVHQAAERQKLRQSLLESPQKMERRGSKGSLDSRKGSKKF